MQLYRSLALGLVLATLALASLPVLADTQPGMESNRLNRPSDTIGATGSGLFGEQVDFYSGTTDFDVTDISLPGNSALPVRLARHLSVVEADQYGGYQGFANWEIEVPYLTGYFSERGWAVGSAASVNRCSIPTDQANAAWPPNITKRNNNTVYGVQYWSGNRMYIPGAGSQEMLVNSSASPHPTDGNTYRWITKNLWAFRCLPALQSGGTGEGFVAMSPDGVKITFDRMVSHGSANTKIRMNWTDPRGGKLYDDFYRFKHYIVATRMEDRFGNWVNYNYDASNNLTSITANDGRAITLTYGADGYIASASSGTHTWTYQYTLAPLTKGDNRDLKNLTGVVQPDGAAWGYQYAGDLVLADTSQADPDLPIYMTCDQEAIPSPAGAGYYTLTATHPSGTTGVFHFVPLVRGRSYVAGSCQPDNPKQSEQFALFDKTLSGPGLPAYRWNYTYSPPNDSWSKNCTAGCPSTIWTDVANPDGTRVRRIFGNKYQATEGQLQDTIVYQASTGVEIDHDTTTYLADTTGQPFPANIGQSPHPSANYFLSQTLHPMLTHTKLRDGVTFSSQVNAFDLYANPLSQTAFSSLGSSRTDTSTFDHNTNLWVLGQAKTAQSGGIVVSDKTYSPTTALLQSVNSYGRFDQSYTFLPDGNLATVTDGNNRTVTLSNYYRGVPRSVAFPNATSKTAVVDGDGHVTALTDEMGYTSTFGYDPMGRLSSIAQPTADSVAWTPTTIAFAQIASAEYGLPAGHWRKTTTTGNATSVSYYDGFLQPVLTQDYDAANAAGTTRFSSKAFDFAGRATFGSYPVKTIAAYNSAIPGTRSSFDGLGRPTSTVQDSELGALTTSYAYLPGFQTRVTNPRGYATTTSYQVFDSPDTSRPLTIASPANASTTIARDSLGKPLTLTRTDATNGAISTTRSYVYDANQRLCKRIEPETGATLMDYDAANNIAWTVTGSALTGNTCDRASVATIDKTVRSYDTLNRPLTVDVPNSTNDLAYTYFNDGALKTLVSGPSTWAYTYNKRRLPVTEQLVIDGRTKTTTHAYNPLGQESSLTYPSGLIVATTPNALGQPTQAGTFATGINYFANGGMAGFTYGNGIVHSLTQNARFLPLRSLDQKTGSAAVLDDTYAFDANANVAAISDGTTGNGSNRTMLYDGLDRLTSTNAPHQWWINATTSYDALDNIRSNTVGNRTYSYAYDPTSKRLSQLTRPDTSVAMTLGYDAFGNVTSKGVGQDSYVFDAANRMTAVTGKESYQYDGFGRRVKITRLSDNKLDYPIYTLSGQLLTDDDQRTGKTTDYVSLNGSLVAKNTATIGTTTWTTTYEHTDALHSPVAETDSAGTTTRIERYTPYGEPSDTTYTQGPGFTGHVTDAATGLTYAQARYYDSVCGCFLSPDPMTVDTTTGWNFNRYNYGSNNPYKFTDPDGRAGDRELNAWGDYVGTHQEEVKPMVPAAIAVTAAMTGAGEIIGAVKTAVMIRNALSDTPTVKLTEGQTKNLARFESKLPKANTGTTVSSNGKSVNFKSDVPGKVPGSKAVYEKTVNEAGETTKMTKTTIDPQGEVVHVKDKLDLGK